MVELWTWKTHSHRNRSWCRNQHPMLLHFLRRYNKAGIHVLFCKTFAANFDFKPIKKQHETHQSLVEIFWGVGYSFKPICQDIHIELFCNLPCINHLYLLKKVSGTQQKVPQWFQQNVE